MKNLDFHEIHVDYDYSRYAVSKYVMEPSRVLFWITPSIDEVRADKPSLSWAHFRQMSACSVFFLENIPGSPNYVETLDSAKRPIEQ